MTPFAVRMIAHASLALWIGSSTAAADEKTLEEWAGDMFGFLAETHESQLANDPAYGLRIEGDALLREERFADAARAYGEAAGHRPDAPILHLRHGYALLRSGQQRDGLAALDRSLALSSGSDPWVYRLQTYRGMGLGELVELDASIAAFTASIESRPSAFGHSGRAAAHGRQGRIDLAARDYRAAVSLEPDNEQLAAIATVVEEMHASNEFVRRMAGTPGAAQTKSGLVYIQVHEGSGRRPAASDTVSVHYHGTLRDGDVFDSSVDRGSPTSFPLDRVVQCFTEGVQKMRVGGRSRLVCPASIAYGEQGTALIPPGSALLYEIELLGIE